MWKLLAESRGLINGKAGKATALPKFSDMLTLFKSGGADYDQPMALSHLKIFRDYAPAKTQRQPIRSRNCCCIRFIMFLIKFLAN